MNEQNTNPYVAPTPIANKSIPRFRSRLISWTLFIVAFVTLFLSIEECWFGLKLMNQEHWHLWSDTSTITNVEFNGTAVSLDEAARNSFRTVVIIWFVAGLLFATSRYLHPPKKLKTID